MKVNGFWTAATVSLLFVAQPCLAEGQPKGADRERRVWEWSIEERVARRTAPEAVRALRVRITTGVPLLAASAVRIDGRTHPELLLPIELFRNLLSGLGAHPDGPNMLSRSFGPIATRVGLPDDFILQVNQAAGEYVSRDTRIRSLNARVARKFNGDEAQTADERNGLAAVQCATLADTLSRVRQRFGVAKVDRFLYEAIAPGMVVTLLEAERPDELLAWEGGCK